MGIYRDNLSKTVIGDNLLAIIIITQISSDLSITNIHFVIYLLSLINYRDKRFSMHAVFKLLQVGALAHGKNTRCPLNLVAIFKKPLFVLFKAAAKSINCKVMAKSSGPE